MCWDDLGIYQMLTKIPIDVLGPDALHAGLANLLEDSRAADLLPTLERYLDFAGDVKQTAAVMPACCDLVSPAAKDQAR